MRAGTVIADHDLSLLHLAIVHHKSGIIRTLIRDCKIDPSAYDKYGDTPLILAARSNSSSFVECLVENGADINTPNSEGHTALRKAIRNEQVIIAKFLIKAGADLSLRDKHDNSPLHDAVSRNLPYIVEALLNEGADVNAIGEDEFTPIGIAVSHNYVAIAKLLLEKGADVHDTSSGSTLVKVACEEGYEEAFALLVHHGADLSEVDDRNYTLLHVAAAEGRTEIVKLLLEHGLNVSATANSDKTPLHCAAWTGGLEAVKLLIERDADPSAVNSSGETPLYQAAMNGNQEVVEYLLGVVQKEVGLERRNNNGYTPLLAAVSFDHVDTVEALLDAGADINVLNYSGSGALIVAMDMAYSESIKRLLGTGRLDINKKDIRGRTCLLTAALLGREEEVELLLSQEPRPISNTKDIYGATPLIMAARNGHIRIIKRLLDLDDASLREVDMFGRDVFYWAALCRNSTEATRILAPHAEAMGVEMPHPRDQSFEAVECRFGPWVCDVCGRSTTSHSAMESQGPVQICRTCVLDHGPGFLVCFDCGSHGATCLDASHILEFYECDCMQRAQEEETEATRSTGEEDDDENVSRGRDWGNDD